MITVFKELTSNRLRTTYLLKYVPLEGDIVFD